jgi:hypothetical protein
MPTTANMHSPVHEIAGDTSATGRIDLLAPAHVGLSASPIYVARIPAAPFAVVSLPLQRTPNPNIHVGMHHNRLMMSVDSFAHLPIRVRKLRRCHAALRSR